MELELLFVVKLPRRKHTSVKTGPAPSGRIKNTKIMWQWKSIEH